MVPMLALCFSRRCLILALASSALLTITATKFFGLKRLLIFARITLNLVAGSSFPFFLLAMTKKLSVPFFTAGVGSVTTVDILSCADTQKNEAMSSTVRMVVGFITVVFFVSSQTYFANKAF